MVQVDSDVEGQEQEEIQKITMKSLLEAGVHLGTRKNTGTLKCKNIYSPTEMGST